MQHGDGIVFSSLNSLVRLRAQVAALQALRQKSRARNRGGYRALFKGRGMDFAESRPYQPGDDVRTIDWKVTARSGKVHTKIFQEERERPVLVWVDLRPSMFFATQGRFKSVLAAEIAALWVWKTLDAGDRIGGFVQTAHHCAEIKPLHSRGVALHLLRQIADNTQLEPSAIPVAFNLLEESWARMQRVASAGTHILIVSDFRQATPAALRQLALLARHCELSLVQIRDPFEEHLPKANTRLRLTDGAQSLWVNMQQQWRQRYEQRAATQQADLQSFARRYGMTYLAVSTALPPAERLLHLSRGLV